MKQRWLPMILLAVTILACGGTVGVPTGPGGVAGLILDTDGNPVRGARVFMDTGAVRETVSNSSGSFALTNIPAADVIIKATVSDGSTSFYGENQIRVFQNEQVSNCNITVLRANQIGSISGRVTTNTGLRIEGARISARPTDNSVFTTSQAITNSDGFYTLSGLWAGKSYQIVATNPGFGSSELLRTPLVGSVVSANFSLGLNSDPRLPQPQNFTLTSWTSPSEISRDRELSKTYEAVKMAIDKRYRVAKANSRLTSGGNPVEVQLFWTPIDSLQLLGYNVYRARGNDDYNKIEFLADPLADGFLDSDPSLRDGVNYRYVTNAANTNYPDTVNSEGPDTVVKSVVPLGDMTDLGVITTSGSAVFRWATVPGAANYTVYVFDAYPSVGIQPYANNFNNPVAGNSFTYNLTPALVPGRRYYYLIMGANSDDSARTLSRIGEFIAP
jgi:hypothetical protein